MLLLAVQGSSLLGYFWPEKAAAQLVVEIEALLGLLWLAALVAHTLRICRALGATRRLDALVPDLSEDVRTRPAEISTTEQAQSAFAARAAAARLDPDHPVAQHLQTIFAAGYCDSNLEVAELVRKTDEDVCRLDGFTRATIGLFVILGLLGTLFGVADAVRALTEAQKPEIRDFLGELRGAFAPSLLGVALSVLWVVLYALAAIPLRSRFRVLLRERTVRTWVPSLRLSTSQRLTEAAQLTLAAATKVVAFAAGIEENTDRWNRAVSASAEAAASISVAMTLMNNSVGTARQVVEETLADLGLKLQAFGIALGEWNSIKERIVEFQGAVAEFQRRQAETGDQIRDHALRLAETTGTLRKELKESLDGLTGAAGSLFGPVSDAARNLEAVGADFAGACVGLLDGLQVEVASQVKTLEAAHQQNLDAVREFFATMTGELRAKGEDLARQLQNLKEPFENAAGNLRDVSAASVTQWNTMIQDFNRRIDNLIIAIRESRPTGPTPLPQPFWDNRRWEELMTRLGELRATPSFQPVVDKLGSVAAELDQIRELLRGLSPSQAPSSGPPRRLVPDFGVGEKVSTVSVRRGRRKDD